MIPLPAPTSSKTGVTLLPFLSAARRAFWGLSAFYANSYLKPDPRTPIAPLIQSVVPATP